MTARELIEIPSEFDPDLLVFTFEEVRGYLEIDEVKVHTLAHLSLPKTGTRCMMGSVQSRRCNLNGGLRECYCW